jgi:hypothetical protein
MAFTGGCYCGGVRYECDGPVRMRGLCFCRTCQVISGGAGNPFVGVMADVFRYTKGEPREFAHPERETPPVRSFCAMCGVQLTSRSPKAPGGVLIRVGTLDDLGVFEGPQVVVWTSEMQPWHQAPPGVPSWPQFPRPKG